MSCPIYIPKIVPSVGSSAPPSKVHSPGQTWPIIPNGTANRSAIFPQLKDKQTDRQDTAYDMPIVTWPKIKQQAVYVL